MELPDDHTELVAAANHELRTPLTVITGYAELLLEEDSLTPQQRGWLELISASSAQLEQAIDAVVARLAG